MSYIKIQKILKEDVETPEDGYIYFGYDDPTVGSGVTGGFWIKDDTGSGATYLFNGYSNAPSIISINPTSAYNGDTILISGINFLGDVVATFSGITGMTTVISPNQISVIIPDLPNYDNEIDVILKSSLGIGSPVKYRVYLQINKPIITNLPSSADINSTITINGLYFIAGQTEVYFSTGSIAGNTTVISSTELSVIVPIVQTGSTQLYIQTNLGQSLLTNITITNGNIPIVTNFYPTYSYTNNIIGIFGENFSYGSQLVRFGPNEAAFINIINSSYLQATISNNTPIGDTLIHINDMTFSGFTVCGTTSSLIPTITSISSSVYSGNTVTMTGTNLNMPMTITLSGIKCEPTYINSNTCSIYIGYDVSPGINTVIVINKYGSSLPYSYTVLNSENLTITGFSNTHMERGAHSIGLYGSGFTSNPSMSVYVGNVLSNFSYNNSSSLTVQILNSTSTSDTIPTGNVDIRVKSLNYSYTLNGFTVDTTIGTNPPTITKVSPIFGKYGDIIDVYGTYLTNSKISFGTSYPGVYGISNIINDNHSSVIVPSGLTQSNDIINIYATTVNGSYTYSPFESYSIPLQKPTITNITPTSGNTGTIITILGTNFVKYYTDVSISVILNGVVTYLVLDSLTFISTNEIIGVIPNVLPYVGSSVVKVSTSAGTDQSYTLIIT